MVDPNCRHPNSVIRFLQFWRNMVAFVFGASTDSQEQVENRPHCITSDGGTAGPSDATSSGEGEWEEISTALAGKPSAPRELQISYNIDPAGEFKVPLVLADEASQPTDAAATGPSAQYQTPPPRRSLEDSEEQGIIIPAQRTPKPAVQDVKTGKQVLIVTTNHKCNRLDALYQDRFRELELELELKFGKPELDTAAAGGLPVEAKPFQGLGHVPPSVSEGSVSTFALHVDERKTTLVPSLEKRRTAAGEGAEVLANLEQTSPNQKSLPKAIDRNDLLGQGSSSSCFM